MMATTKGTVKKTAIADYSNIRTNDLIASLSSGSASVEENSSLFKRQDAASPLLRGLDVYEPRTAAEKAAQLLTAEIKSVEQAKQSFSASV